VFARHYLGEDMKSFSNQVLEIEANLVETLFLTKPIDALSF